MKRSASGAAQPEFRHVILAALCALKLAQDSLKRFLWPEIVAPMGERGTTTPDPEIGEAVPIRPQPEDELVEEQSMQFPGSGGSERGSLALQPRLRQGQ